MDFLYENAGLPEGLAISACMPIALAAGDEGKPWKHPPRPSPFRPASVKAAGPASRTA
jgi:hypothetical protein